MTRDWPRLVGFAPLAGLARRYGGALAALLLAAGCSAGVRSSSVTPIPPASPELTAAMTTVGQINDTAGGPVAAQRAVLDSLAAPDERGDQLACPTATTTLAFDPAYRALRADPGAAGVLLLPTYITIYTGDRITGSDLTTLHLQLIGGRARTTALCVS